jgi:hypothetical protein
LTRQFGRSKLKRRPTNDARQPGFFARIDEAEGIAMKMQLFNAGPSRRFLCAILGLVMAIAPSVWAVAQGFGAVQAVRQRVSGLERGPEAPPGEVPPAPGPGAPGQPGYPGPTAGKLDTTYVSPTASALLVIRPAQLMASPMAQVFPIEVASAAGLKYLGIDPVDVEEALAFVDMSNPIAPAFGVTVKFTKPFRAAALPPGIRPNVKLSEFNGKKYLQSGHPLWPSFYGPNNKTMIVAPDVVLRQIVQSSGQPKSGALLDRVRDVPAGSDLYLAVEMASLRPLMQMGMAQAQAKAPPEAKQYMEALNLVAAAELTLNIVTPGPTSLVVHGNDEAAAQQLETVMQEVSKKYQGTAPEEQPASDDPVKQALARYKERMSRPFQSVRNGTIITCFQIDGQDPAQRQLTSVAVIGIAVALLLPAVQAAREAARRAQAAGGPSGPPAGPEGGAEAAPTR